LTNPPAESLATSPLFFMTHMEYKYLRHGEPLPEGWQYAARLDDTHHGIYARLIKREVQDDDKEA